MVFGAVAWERIQLNEDSLWYGGPRSRLNPDARAHVAKVREPSLSGRIRETERLSMTALAGVPGWVTSVIQQRVIKKRKNSRTTSSTNWSPS